jgi:hypothetical protein
MFMGFTLGLLCLYLFFYLVLQGSGVWCWNRLWFVWAVGLSEDFVGGKLCIGSGRLYFAVLTDLIF